MQPVLMSYTRNVFINYPFDKQYLHLIRPLVFTLVYLDFTPQIAKTTSSGNIRVIEIQKLIAKSKFSIHDLSRSSPVGGIPRFNMPFELGMDIGCKRFGGRKYSYKKSLILHEKRFSYKRIISDIAGQDIKNHDNSPRKLITKVRDWFSDISTRKYPGGSEIWYAFNQFNSDLITNLKSAAYTKRDMDQMPIGDFIKFSKEWINNFKTA